MATGLIRSAKESRIEKKPQWRKKEQRGRVIERESLVLQKVSRRSTSPIMRKRWTGLDRREVSWRKIRGGKKEGSARTGEKKRRFCLRFLGERKGINTESTEVPYYHEREGIHGEKSLKE